MGKIKARDIALVLCGVIAVCMIFQGWDNIVSFLSILFTSIVPLVLGFAIAYVVSIPANFFERHFLPNAKSAFVTAIRRPVCLLVTAIIAVSALALSSSVLIPALIDTVRVVQQHGQGFIEGVVEIPPFKFVREPVLDFVKSDFFQDLKNLDISGLAKAMFGGSVGSLTTQMLTVVSTVMTGFFGLLFSFILLTDNTGALQKFTLVMTDYLGPKRSNQVRTLLRVADSSFHSFIVRQFSEAIILGTVGSVVLALALGEPIYAVGVGVLLGLAALVPIVGYPVGLFLGAFMAVLYNGWAALLYIVCVVIAQMLEATFLQPRIGDRNTVLPPVWVTVGVTIGGGIAGFVGMLVAIPLASTVYQLVYIDLYRRRDKRAKQGLASEEEIDSSKMTDELHTGEVELPKSLKNNDGGSVGKIE